MVKRAGTALALVGSFMLFAQALAALGCGGRPEESLLSSYFRASRVRDRMTLANIATVAFDPNKDGQVEEFDIAAVGPEQTQTLHLREYAREMDEAVAASEELSKQMKAYQDANLDAVSRVLKAEAGKGRLAGADLAVQKEWTRFRTETAERQKRVSEARTKLNAERALAEPSVVSGGQTVDVTAYDGVVVTKDVTINARVRMPDGQVSEKTLVVTLSQARLKDEKGQELIGRWIVSGIKGD